MSSPDFFMRVKRKLKSYIKYFVKVDKNLYIFSPITIPSNRYRILSQFNLFLLSLQIYPLLLLFRIQNPIVFVANPFFLPFIQKLKIRALAYFVTDKYSADETQDLINLNVLQRKMLKKADAVFCVSAELYSSLINSAASVYYTPHGVDFNHFSPHSSVYRIPVELQSLRRPIVGYMGSVDGKTLDEALLHKVIPNNQEMSFVFIGSFSNELKSLMQYENCLFLGKRDYALLPNYIHTFDVCILPFKQSEWIHYCNPIKLKEYLAAGKPAVSTYFPQIKFFQHLVYCASGHEDFSRLLRKAIAEDNQSLIQQRVTEVRGHDWQFVAENIINKVINNPSNLKRDAL